MIQITTPNKNQKYLVCSKKICKEEETMEKRMIGNGPSSYGGILLPKRASRHPRYETERNRLELKPKKLEPL